jgi:phosphatidylserine/phosphatidylglycerophosphate/cardiolipin synthase-like enzyme
MSLKSLNIVFAALLVAVSGSGFREHVHPPHRERSKELSAPSAQTKQFAPGTSYTLCFVPNGPACESLLVNTINNTRSSLLIQAYSFTSPPIAEAVVNVFKRGLDVRVIVDKSQVSEKYTSATFLKNVGIPVVIDTKPAIAHNKVMIFDQLSVFTGSFNFTRSAQDRNAENGLVIHDDTDIVKAYTNNWTNRHQLASAH